jgi:hypothetical protein
LVIRSIRGSSFIRPRYFAAAPTFGQAKAIYWNDLKALYPRSLIADVSETNLTITLTTGAEVVVFGMDKPQRIEGQPWDGGILDEYADMKAQAWPENVFPALADRNGWADLIGVPEGRNHYFDTYNYAVDRMEAYGNASEWGAFTWKSADILPAAKIAEFTRTLDPQTFRQELEASFEAVTGVVLYAFDRLESVKPFPGGEWRGLPLHIGMDFNLNPMTATVWVEYGGVDWQVDEIILDTSDTDKMSKEILARYSPFGNIGRITIYPDASGQSGRTSAGGKTDHSILRGYGFRLVVDPTNPAVRDRINTGNSRFLAADGVRRAFVVPACVKSIKAYGSHVYAKGSNEPDKTSGYDHIFDASTYMLWQRYRPRVVAQASYVNFMGR